MNMTPEQWNDHFGLPGVLTFEQHGELTRAQITLPTSSATLYLQGAHLTHWQPAGVAPVLFLSEHSAFAPGKAIRGGIPICFPWFGPDTEARNAGKPGPSHGFARTALWEFASAALLPGGAGASDTLRLVLRLGPTDLSRSLGFDQFYVAYELIVGADAGRTLTLKLFVANGGTQPLRFEEALHSYFAIADVRQTTVSGLAAATYLDKTDSQRAKTTGAGPLAFAAQTDSVFPANQAAPTILESTRTIAIDKVNSATTVVWNPWQDGAATLPDLAPDAWQHFLCVETANTGSDAITLAPGQAHTMEARITLST